MTTKAPEGISPVQNLRSMGLTDAQIEQLGVNRNFTVKGISGFRLGMSDGVNLIEGDDVNTSDVFKELREEPEYKIGLRAASMLIEKREQAV